MNLLCWNDRLFAKRALATFVEPYKIGGAWKTRRNSVPVTWGSPGLVLVGKRPTPAVFIARQPSYQDETRF